jgi:hypothetical protein
MIVNDDWTLYFIEVYNMLMLEAWGQALDVVEILGALILANVVQSPSEIMRNFWYWIMYFIVNANEWMDLGIEASKGAQILSTCTIVI